MGAFVTVGLVTGAVSWAVLERQTPGRRRLRSALADNRAAAPTPTSANPLTARPSPIVERISSFVPKSPAEMTRLRRRLVRAGYHGLGAAVVFSLAEILTPAILGLSSLLVFGWPKG